MEPFYNCFRPFRMNVQMARTILLVSTKICIKNNRKKNEHIFIREFGVEILESETNFSYISINEIIGYMYFYSLSNMHIDECRLSLNNIHRYIMYIVNFYLFFYQLINIWISLINIFAFSLLLSSLKEYLNWRFSIQNNSVFWIKSSSFPFLF